ncbi:hypothetical protein Taro_010138 [Colocasia esculenta]|uniref:Uncharacterized protein n=1 Tax=Colocasia esculenta TaxID=4460 RepID=A0A843U7I3_COLES|nr:hypothetical protein [Colocasia esculenta]
MFSMKIWCVEEDLVAVLGGASVGGLCSPHLWLYIHIINVIRIATVVSPPAPPTVPAVTAVGASFESPLVAAEDAVSLQEGGGSFYESTLWEVWINGDKIEPAQASQFITRTLQAHFPRPIHRFNDFPMEVQEHLYQMFMSQHRFTRRPDEARSRFVWTMTARSNFKHLMYNARKNTEKHSQSAGPTLWKERAPSWMRGEYWETLGDIWAAEKWQQTSSIMKVNRAANPEANMHSSGSVSFATHQSRLEKELKRQPTFSEVFDRTHKKKGTDAYISDRARVVAESYREQMTEKYAGEDEQPPLDHEVWVAAAGAPKKGHVYGFGHSIDTSRVLSGGSSSGSQTSAFHSGVGTPDADAGDRRTTGPALPDPLPSYRPGLLTGTTSSATGSTSSTGKLF